MYILTSPPIVLTKEMLLEIMVAKKDSPLRNSKYAVEYLPAETIDHFPV